MHPILLKLGPVTLHTYGATLVIALLIATWFAKNAVRAWPRENIALPSASIADFVSLSLLGGLIGARLFYVALNWQLFAHSPQDIPAIWQGGLVWYGGFAGGVVSAWFFVRAKRLSLLRVLDQMIPFMVLAHAIGRIGCFLNGCCYGKPTQSWCGVVFPGLSEPALPIQLLESGGLFLLYAGLRRLQRPPILKQPGALLGCYLMAYAVLRFAVEFFRGDQTIAWAGLTLQQLLSVIFLIIGFGLVRPFRQFRQFRRLRRRT